MHNITEASVSVESKGKTKESVDMKLFKCQLMLSPIKTTGDLEERYNLGLVIYLAEGGPPHTHMQLKDLERLLWML